MTDDPREVCPRCETALGGEQTCPECGLEIRTDDGELTSKALDSVVEQAIPDEPQTPPAPRTLPYSFRFGIALMIAIPFAPLAGFVISSIVPPHPMVIIVVSMVSWLSTAALLANVQMPSLIVGRGLTVLGCVVAITPLVVLLARMMVGNNAVSNPAIGQSRIVTGSFLIFGILILIAGIAVSRMAISKRNSWRDVETHVKNRRE